MTRFNLEILDIIVTKWNEEMQDWSGEKFSKEGFSLGYAKSNKIDDVITTINTVFDVKKEHVEVNEDGQLIFTVIENAYGLQDDNGQYLVDYIVEIEKVETVGIEGEE